MSELLFVKLGGSLITDKNRPYTVRQEVLDRLCQELRTARARCSISLVLGHGAGSFAHVSAAQHHTHQGLDGPGGWRGFCEVHHDAQRLNAMVREAMSRAGELAVTLQPSAACMLRGGRVIRYDMEPIRRLLVAGVVPMIYGDACVDEELGFSIASTEELLRHLAGALRPARVILVGKVDGVLDQHGAVIPEITPETLPEVEGALRASDGVADVTGGMLQKVRLALELGAPTEIINGMIPGLLTRALEGERGLGTTITPT